VADLCPVCGSRREEVVFEPPTIARPVAADQEPSRVALTYWLVFEPKGLVPDGDVRHKGASHTKTRRERRFIAIPVRSALA
jgi:hypothetical protein